MFYSKLRIVLRIFVNLLYLYFAEYDQSLFGNDYSDEDPTYSPPNPPKTHPIDIESDEDEILPTEALHKFPSLECYQNEAQIVPIEVQIEMWITLLLDKILDDVWRNVHKPKRWKKVIHLNGK